MKETPSAGRPRRTKSSAILRSGAASSSAPILCRPSRTSSAFSDSPLISRRKARLVSAWVDVGSIWSAARNSVSALSYSLFPR